MRHNIFLTILFTIFISISVYGTTKIISTSGNAFNPGLLNIELGDTITFNLSSPHTALEVDQSTWNANGTTSNGGFHFVSGTSTLILTDTGTYYFVCEPHASLGMKGRIRVDSVGIGTGVFSDQPLQEIKVFPTYVFGILNLELTLTGKTDLKIELVNMEGKNILTFVGNKKVLAGVYKDSFDLSYKITQGIYFVKTTVNENISFEKIIVGQ